jgi:hypothetical protein
MERSANVHLHEASSMFKDFEYTRGMGSYKPHFEGLP